MKHRMKKIAAKTVSKGSTIRLLFLLSTIPALVIVGCASRPDFSQIPSEIARDPTVAAPYRIENGDTLLVKFPYTDRHDEEVVVQPDGLIVLGVTGEIKAAGLTTVELEEAIRSASSKRLRDPQVFVTVKSSAQKVYVGGEVKTAGFVPFRENLTPLQAVFERGGFTDAAQWEKIYLIELGENAAYLRDLDLQQIASVTLKPNHVIFVPKTGVAKANQAVDQYIRRMLPFSMNYDVYNMR